MPVSIWKKEGDNQVVQQQLMKRQQALSPELELLVFVTGGAAPVLKVFSHNRPPSSPVESGNDVKGSVQTYQGKCLNGLQND